MANATKPDAVFKMPLPAIEKLDQDNFHEWEVVIKSWFTLNGWSSMLTDPNALPAHQDVGKAILITAVSKLDLQVIDDAATVADAMTALRSRRVGEAAILKSQLTSDLWSLTMQPNETMTSLAERVREIAVRLKSAGHKLADFDMATACINAVKRSIPSLASHCDFLIGLGHALTLKYVENSLGPMVLSTGQVPGAFMTQGERKSSESQSLTEAIACLVKEVKGLKNNRNNSGRHGRGGVGKNRGLKGNVPLAMKCYNCGGGRHLARECKKPCQACGKYGHGKHQCQPQGGNWRAQSSQMRRHGDKRGGDGRANMAVGSSEPNHIDWEEGVALMANGFQHDPMMPSAMPSPFLPVTGNAGKAYASMAKKGVASYMWVLDGGATHHMTPFKCLLTDYQPAQGRVKVADDKYVPRAGVGSLVVVTKVNGVEHKRIIKNVWHVPDLGQSLLSVMQLKLAGCWHTSGKNGSLTEFIFDDIDDTLWLQCPEKNGLNVADWHVQTINPKLQDQVKSEVIFRGYRVVSIEEYQRAKRLKTSSACMSVVGTVVEDVALYASANHATDKETPQLWHQRLGHVSWDNLSKLVKGGLVRGVSVPPRHFNVASKCTCDVCVMAKHRRAPFHSRPDRAEEPLKVVHSDVCGPYPVVSLGGGKYVLTVLDECTEYAATIIMRSKEEVSGHLKSVLLRWEKQTGYDVKRVYTDRGTEYINRDFQSFCLSKGIIHEPSVPYTPQENGKAERLNETLNDMVRAMLLQYNLYQPLWSYAMTYATMIRNCTLSSRLHITPYQSMWGKVPDVSNFRTFGCKVFARLPEPKRKKLDWKSVLGIYLGPEVNSAGCKVLVYDPQKKGDARYKLHIVRDVVTYESLSDTVGVQDHAKLYWGGKIPFPTPTEVPQVVEPQPMSGHIEPPPIEAFALPAPHALNQASPVNHDAPSRQINAAGQVDLAQERRLPHSSIEASGELAQVPKQVGVDTRGVSAADATKATKSGAGVKRMGVVYNVQSDVPDSKRSRRNKEEMVYELMGTFGVQNLYHGPVPVLSEVNKYECPRSIKQCMASPYAKYWAEAIVEEWSSLVENGTWEIVEREPSMKVIPCHWVFTIKTNANGMPERFKARLVAGGNHQQEDVDFKETFAPVSKLATLRVLLSVSARRGWKVHQIDIKTAFLNGEVDTDVYMLQPPGFVDGTNLVCKLQKCLYGLKQAPRQWYLTLASLLRDLGFEAVPADTSFWVKKDGSVIVYLTSVVDDMLLASADETTTLGVIHQILRVFKGTHGGIAHHYNGMKITWLPSEKSVVLSQHKHVEVMLDRYAAFAPVWSPRKLPMKDGLKLHKNGTSDVLESEPLDVAVYPYRALVGSLNYLACTTRPDIAYAVNQLAKYSNAPMVAHWEAAIDCLRYLKGTMHWGLKLGSGGGPSGELVNLIVRDPLDACAYADANHATGIDDKRSVTGFVLQVYGGPVTWASRTQRLTSTSTTESEFRALSACAKEVLWLVKVLEHFDIRPAPFKVFGDSQGAIQSLKNYSCTRHTKHIEVHHDFMRERYAAGQLDFVHIPGTMNPADIFTKALGRQKFEQFRRGLGMAVLHE